MKHRFGTKWALVCAALATLAVSACTTEEAYDDLTKKNGIDMTVNIADGGLTLPLGSTDKIMLTELIDPDDSEEIELDEAGNYYLKTDGNLDATSVDIKGVSFEVDPMASDRHFMLFVDKAWTAADSAIIDMLPQISPLVGVDMTGATATTGDIFSGVKESTSSIIGEKIEDFTVNNIDIKAENIDEALLAIHGCSLKETVDGKVKLEISDLPYADQTYKIVLSDLTITLPDYVVALDLETGAELPNSTVKVKDIVMTKAAGSTSVSGETTLFRVKRIDCADEPFINNGGTISRNDTLKISARADFEGIQITNTDVFVAKYNDYQEFVLAKTMKLKTTFSVNTIRVDKLYGRFYPEVDDITSTVDINMGEDLDFLKDDNILLDVKNPQLAVNLTNDCKITAYADITLDTHNGRPITYRNVLLTPSDGNKMRITLTATDEDRANNMYANEALSTLIQPVPDKMDVTVKIHTDSTLVCEFPVGTSLSIAGDYDVKVPFDFNEIYFVYDEEIEDIFTSDDPDDDQVSDFLKCIENAQLAFTITNAVDMDIDVTLSAKGKDGKESSSLVEFTPVRVAASETSDLIIALSIPNISAVKDLIVRLEGHGKDCNLNGNQYIKLDNIKLTVQDLDIDLNDKD